MFWRSLRSPDDLMGWSRWFASGLRVFSGVVSWWDLGGRGRPCRTVVVVLDHSLGIYSATLKFKP